MKEPEIVVLSGETRIDNYGNFFFKDKTGQEHKVGTKREDFDILCATVKNNPDRAVELSYGEYMNRSFVVGVKLLAEDVKVDESKLKLQEPAQEFSPQEVGMWWKEVGENIRAGITKYDTAIGKAEILAYKARMHLVLGIKEIKKED